MTGLETLSTGVSEKIIHLKNKADLKKHGIDIDSSDLGKIDRKTTLSEIKTLKRQLEAGGNKTEILKAFLSLEKKAVLRESVIDTEALKQTATVEGNTEIEEEGEEERLLARAERLIEGNDGIETLAGSEGGDKLKKKTKLPAKEKKEGFEKLFSKILEAIPASMKTPEAVKTISVVGGIASVLYGIFGSGSLFGGLLGGAAIIAGGLALGSYMEYGKIRNFLKNPKKSMRGLLGIKEKKEPTPEEIEAKIEKKETLLYRESLEAFLAVSPLTEPVISKTTPLDKILYAINNWTLEQIIKGDHKLESTIVKEVIPKKYDRFKGTLLNPKIASHSILYLRKNLKSLKKDFPDLQQTLYLLLLKSNLLKLLSKNEGYDYQKIPLKELFLRLGDNLGELIAVSNFISFESVVTPSSANIYGRESGGSFLEARSSESGFSVDIISILQKKDAVAFRKFKGSNSELNDKISKLHKRYPLSNVKTLKNNNEKSIFLNLYNLTIKNSLTENMPRKIKEIIKIVGFGNNIQKDIMSNSMFKITDPEVNLGEIIKNSPLTNREVFKLYIITSGREDIGSLPPLTKIQLYFFIISILEKRNKKEDSTAYLTALIKNVTGGVKNNFPPDVRKMASEIKTGTDIINDLREGAGGMFDRLKGVYRESPGLLALSVGAGIVLWKARPLRKWHRRKNGTVR